MDFKKIAEPLVIIGGINWGLALVNMNLVTMVSGAVGQPVVAQVVYGLVGVSALYLGYAKYIKKK